MSRFLVCFGLIVCIFQVIRGQNLVPNSGFEEFERCPDFLRQLNRAKYWTAANAGTPELFHSCGYTASAVPYEGEGMAGAIFLNESRSLVEYLQVELMDSLRAGEKYCFDCKIMASSDNSVMINRIGAYLSRDRINTPNWEPFIRHPQVFSQDVFNETTNWQSLSGSFKAKGGERFLTIGNFFESYYLIEELNQGGRLRYSYYYIDNVKLWPKKGTCSSIVIDRPEFESQEAVSGHIVYFEKDEFELSLEERERLRAFLKLLKGENVQLRIEGHTDSDASEAYNLMLSKRRTEAVNDYIQSERKIATYLLWQSENEPLNSNLDSIQMSKNRRVEINMIR